MNEFDCIERFASRLQRPTAQRNTLHGSDAELLALGNGVLLAVTTDDLVEELALGLYADPKTVGWVALAASASDLAAVGADPLAALVSLGIPEDLDPDWLDLVAAGLSEAAEANGLRVAGGDTNRTTEFRIGTTAMGTVPDGAALTRRGCVPGDRVFVTGPLGAGAALALAVLSGRPAPTFRPPSRLAEGRALRGSATSCIDTSDGGLDAIGRLARLNGVGFEVDSSAAVDAAAFSAAGLDLAERWLFLASLHGEFELLFTIPQDKCPVARQLGAVEIGLVSRRPGIRVDGRDVDPLAVRALFEGFTGNLHSLIAGLSALPRP